MKHGDLSPSCFLQMEESTFKAASFSKSASARQLSLQERKEAMLEAARKRYREKHGVPWQHQVFGVCLPVCSVYAVASQHVSTVPIKKQTSSSTEKWMETDFFAVRTEKELGQTFWVIRKGKRTSSFAKIRETSWVIVGKKRGKDFLTESWGGGGGQGEGC